MKITTLALATLLAACFVGASCGPKNEPAVAQATVNAAHSSLRARNSSTSRTLKVLEPGDPVEILEQQDRWYRVRSGELEGWMEVRTLLTDAMRSRIQETTDSARGQIPQNTGTLREDANFRIDPGRSTTILRRLAAYSAVEVLERRTVPREDLPGRADPWLKVRSASNEVGWVLSSFVEFDVPEGIAPYTEDLIYSALKELNHVEDPVAGKVAWYLVGERRPGIDPALDFDGIRVFTWNLSRQRYETAYRTKGLRGIYPLETGMDAGKPTFRIYELGPDGQTKTVRDFVMNGVVVREVKKTGK